MSVEINVVYGGSLHCDATHAPSGNSLSTDAPKDNQGLGESFSPTDLVAAALGTCMVTIMGIVARRDNLDIEGTTVKVVKDMVQEPVRRIGALQITITVPSEKAKNLSEVDRKKLQNASKHCPVHQSLHPDVSTPVTIVFES